MTGPRRQDVEQVLHVVCIKRELEAIELIGPKISLSLMTKKIVGVAQCALLRSRGAVVVSSLGPLFWWR